MIELEENLRRKDLTALEGSKTISDLVQVRRELAEQVIAERRQKEKAKESFSSELDEKLDAEELELCANLAHKSRPAHRPAEPASRRQLADAVAIPETTIRRAESHVSFADRYPFLKRPETAIGGALTAKAASITFWRQTRHIEAVARQ